MRDSLTGQKNKTNLTRTGLLMEGLGRLGSWSCEIRVLSDRIRGSKRGSSDGQKRAVGTPQSR
jgi:hypothetical protein